MSEVARKALFNLAAKTVVTIFTLLSFLYLGKSGDQQAVATLAFALSFVGAFTFIFDMGYGSAHIKRLSEGNDEGTCNATFLAIRLTLTAVMAATVLAAIFVWEAFNPSGAFSIAEQKQAIYVILGYFVLFALAQIPVMTFSGRMESAKQQVPETVGTMARAPLIIFAVMAGLGAVALSMSYLVTGLLMCLIAVWLFRDRPVGSASKATAISYTRYATPLMPLILVAILSQNLPPVLIAFFTGSTQEVAGFFMVQRLTLVFILISTSISPILFPKLSETHAKNDMAAIKDICWKTERLISLLMVPLIFATVALAPALIHIFFSDAYLVAAPAMRILAVYALVISLDMAYVTVIYGVDRPDISLRLGLATASVTIASFFILIPPDIYGFELLGGGATGAALALLLGGVAEYAVSRHYARKVAGVVSCGRIWIHVACGVAMAALLVACDWAGLVTRWYSLLAVCAAGLGLYAGLLAASKELGRRDVDFFLDLLNLRKMFSYITTELRGKK